MRTVNEHLFASNSLEVGVKRSLKLSALVSAHPCWWTVTARDVLVEPCSHRGTGLILKRTNLNPFSHGVHGYNGVNLPIGPWWC